MELAATRHVEVADELADFGLDSAMDGGLELVIRSAATLG